MEGRVGAGTYVASELPEHLLPAREPAWRGRLAERGLGNQRNARSKQQRPGRPCVCFHDTIPLPCVSLEGLAGELRRLGLKMASNLLVDPALELSSQIKNL
jgi:hypothetical protein